MPDESPWARPEDEGSEPPDGSNPLAEAATAGEQPIEPDQAPMAGDTSAADTTAEAAPGEPEGADATAETAPDEPKEADLAPATAAAVSSDSSGSAAIAILGMMLLVLSGLIVGLIVYVTDEGGDRFPTGLANDDYDLAAMALREREAPTGLRLAGKVEFNNDEWAIVLDNVDPESRLPQLRAQERVRNHISVFAWPDGGTAHLARTLTLLAQSTLYESESAAEEAIAGAALCGLRLPETSPIDEFVVPSIGHEAVGFFVTSTDADIGISVETVVCFRTGRVVHGIVQSALDGAQDIALVVNLARKMLVHVENAFDGTPDPIDEDPNLGG